MMKTAHAALYYPDGIMQNMTLLSIEKNGWNNKALHEPCRYLHDLADLALENKITHLWVRQEIGGFEKEANYGEYSFQISNRHKRMATVSVWKRGSGHVNIIFPYNTSWWGNDTDHGWMQDATIKETLVTIHYLEEKLGVPVSGSPSATGWALLKLLHGEWIEDIPGVDLKECHFDSSAAKDIIWQRIMNTGEHGKKHVHKFDKNSAYLASAATVDVGVGTPIHVDHGNDATHEKGHQQAVGVWRCTITDVPMMFPIDMPKPWGNDGGWISGPVIRLLRKIGYTVKIHEGYVFPNRHDVLALWAKRLWDIRQEFAITSNFSRPTCAEFARRAIKQIAVATVGVTAYKGFEPDEESEKRRPDIRMQVIARHREVMHHNIEKIRTMYGVTPLMVYMDAVYYLSDEPDGRKAFPELVKRETALGGFKYEGRVEITPDVLAMFETKMSTASRLEFLNKKGWVK